jgi:hypothetical protein
MHRFVDGEDRLQQTLLPNSLEDYVSEENPVRVVEVFINELDLAALGFAKTAPATRDPTTAHRAAAVVNSAGEAACVIAGGSSQSEQRFLLTGVMGYG